jgi:hypothetical protein
MGLVTRTFHDPKWEEGGGGHKLSTSIVGVKEGVQFEKSQFDNWVLLLGLTQNPDRLGCQHSPLEERQFAWVLGI